MEEQLMVSGYASLTDGSRMEMFVGETLSSSRPNNNAAERVEVHKRHEQGWSCCFEQPRLVLPCRHLRLKRQAVEMI